MGATPMVGGGHTESGMVWITHPTSSEPNLPFGAIKRSGYRRERYRAAMTRPRLSRAT
jgi:acyl-CoA reductase-like NAD-dependent aldehyde dehydrogenase